MAKTPKFLQKYFWDIDFAKLDTIAYQYSDNEIAALMREEERKLFEKIRKRDREDGSQRKK